MSFLRRRVDAPSVAVPGAVPGAGPDTSDQPLTRAERKALKAEQAAAAELAARIARAQRRLAHASGPLPVAAPRRSPDLAVPSE